MEFSLGALAGLLGLLAGWLGKGWSAAKKSGSDEMRAELSAAHHLKEFEEFKIDTVSEFKSVRDDFSKMAAAIHERIDNEKKYRAESEARQNASMTEIIRGQGVIEGQLGNMSGTINHILEKVINSGGR